MSARTASLVACGLLFSGCLVPVHFAVGRAAEDIQWEVERRLAPVVNAAERISRCASIQAENVAFREEKTLGDALGVRVAAAKGGLALRYVSAPSVDLQAPRAVTLASPDSVNDRARAVAVVGAGLTRHSGRPEIPWRFGVLASDEVNAVSAPGGLVLVTRGALAAVRTEDALAGILAHEMAHVVLRQALDRYATEKRNACYAALALTGGRPPGDLDAASLESARRLFGDDVARELADGRELDLDDRRNKGLLGGLTSALGESLYTHGMDRPAEVAADALAVDLLLAAGYQPEEFIRLVAALPDKGAFSSHHPSAEDRVKELTKHLGRRRGEEDPFRPSPRTAPLPLSPALVATAN